MLFLPKLTAVAPLLLLIVLKAAALPSDRGVSTAAEPHRQAIRSEGAATAERAYLGPPDGSENATYHHTESQDKTDPRLALRDVAKLSAQAETRDEKGSPGRPGGSFPNDTSHGQPGTGHPRRAAPGAVASRSGCQQKRDETASLDGSQNSPNNPNVGTGPGHGNHGRAAEDDDDDFAAMLSRRAGAGAMKFRDAPNPRISRDKTAAYLAASYEQHYGRKLTTLSEGGDGDGGGRAIKVKQGVMGGPANRKSIEAELQRSYEEHFKHAPGVGHGHGHRKHHEV